MTMTTSAWRKPSHPSKREDLTLHTLAWRALPKRDWGEIDWSLYKIWSMSVCTKLSSSARQRGVLKRIPGVKTYHGTRPSISQLIEFSYILVLNRFSTKGILSGLSLIVEQRERHSAKDCTINTTRTVVIKALATALRPKAGAFS